MPWGPRTPQIGESEEGSEAQNAITTKGTHDRSLQIPKRLKAHTTEVPKSPNDQDTEITRTYKCRLKLWGTSNVEMTQVRLNPPRPQNTERSHITQKEWNDQNFN